VDVNGHNGTRTAGSSLIEVVIDGSNVPAGRFLVDELVPPSRTPGDVRGPAESLLTRFGADWADVVIVARVAPRPQEEAEAWLMATHTDVATPGGIVDVTDSDWSATTSAVFLQQPGSAATRTIHVVQSAKVVAR
jgi:hypothetical protein